MRTIQHPVPRIQHPESRPYYAKQTQFPIPQNRHNLLSLKHLHQYLAPPHERKQTQTNPIPTPRRFTLHASRDTTYNIRLPHGRNAQNKPNFQIPKTNATLATTKNYKQKPPPPQPKKQTQFVAVKPAWGGAKPDQTRRRARGGPTCPGEAGSNPKLSPPTQYARRNTRDDIRETTYDIRNTISQIDSSRILGQFSHGIQENVSQPTGKTVE